MPDKPREDSDAIRAEQVQPETPGKLAVDLRAGTGSPPTEAGALMLARIRAVGTAPAAMPADALLSASTAAALIDRQLIEITGHGTTGRTLALGWAEGAAPDPDRHPSAPPRRLPAVPLLVWAVCVAAAWPHAEAEPYPGRPFPRESVLRACIGMGAHDRTVIAALRLLPQTGLITFSGSTGRLGPAAAVLPAVVWAALRRVHDRLPHAPLLQYQTSTAHAAAPDDGTPPPQGPVARQLPCLPPSPVGTNDMVVRSTVTALEGAQGPVARSDLPALADPALRRATENALAGCGRALISTPDGSWTTGYPDHIAETLAAEQTGTLTREQRAVLALMLLRAVAIPRAQGRHDGTWATPSHPVAVEELTANRRLTRSAITDALRGLRAAGYVTSTSSGGYIPGPALTRLTQSSREALWEDLVILGRPDGYMAERIRSKRRARREAAYDGGLFPQEAGEDQA